MVPAVCIYNPISGRAQAASHLDEIQLSLRKQGYDVQFKRTEYPLHAALLARQAVTQGANLVIAFGGDGTIHEVVGGLALSSIPLAVLPCGTANVLAREIRLPHRLQEILDRIPTFQPVRIALGKGGDRYFISMAGVGFDARVISGMKPRLKEKFGPFAFWLEGLHQWFTADFSLLSGDVDGRRLACTFVVVARISRYGGNFRIAPGADLLGDQFDVCMFTGTTRTAYLRYVLGVLSGTHLRFEDVLCVRGKVVKVISGCGSPGVSEEVKVQMDGELVGTLPMTFEIVPDALTLLIPPRQT